MLLRKIYILFIINISALLCNATMQMTEFNETFEYHAIKSHLAEIQLGLNIYLHHMSKHWRNCADATAESSTSGFYEIHLPNYIQHPFKVSCDAETQGGGWTIIMSRMDGSVDFYRDWHHYKKGFGLLDGEFFLGLDKIHALTAELSQELLVLLEDFYGHEVFEKYDRFAIGNEDEQYVLHTLGKATGTAGDSLSYNHGQKFTTFDRENDSWDLGNCAQNGRGGWWYNSCSRTNLAGIYNGKDVEGVFWQSFRHSTPIKRVTMMIRPRQ